MKDAIKARWNITTSRPIADGSLKKEDLGHADDRRRECTRNPRHHTIPAGQIGNEKAITIVSEHWYSNDLQIVVMSKRSDRALAIRPIR